MYTAVRLLILLAIPTTIMAAIPKQLTFDPKNHALDDNHNFSPDDRFLVYDTRPGEGFIMEGRTIEKVEIASAKISVIYYAPVPVTGQGPGVGAMSYHPTKDLVIMIHGPLTSTGLAYDQACRYGVMVSGSGEGEAQYADARDTTEPFTPGALRGGTHCHEFDGTGQWVGFTYNDVIMKALGTDLRTIGVTRLGHPVKVDPAPGHMDGLGFSALVVHVVPDPKPGSDEVSRAADDTWVGINGYLKPDGTRQLARAFIGDTRDSNGKLLKDVFIVDIPEDITKPGPLGPLEGTSTTVPAPVAGASQRRLTHTGNRKHPGCGGIIRTNPDGTSIAFRAYDDEGAEQIFLISPNGGPMRQLSHLPGGIVNGPRWLPSGKAIITIDAQDRLVAISTVEGESFGKHGIILDDGGPKPYAHVISNDGKTIAFNRDIPTDGTAYRQIFVVDYNEGPDGLPRQD